MTGENTMKKYDVYAHGTYWGQWRAHSETDAMQIAADDVGTVDVGQERASTQGMTARATFVEWTDDMICEYFDTRLNATLHEICALSGRSKADVKRVLMQGKSA